MKAFILISLLLITSQKILFMINTRNYFKAINWVIFKTYNL